VEDFRKLAREIRQRPVATIVSGLALFLLFHLPAEAVASWINDQIAALLGINKPTVGEIVQFAIARGLPFIGAVAVMVAYHAGQQPAGSSPPPPEPPRRRLTSLELWYLAAFGFAIVAIGEVLIHRSAEPLALPGPPGPQGIPGPQGPPGPSVADSRVDGIQQEIAKLRPNIQRLLRLASLERCEQRIATVEDQFEETAEAAKKLIGLSNTVGPLGGRIAIHQGWDSKISQLRILTKLCDPSLDTRLDPTDDELHTKTADEPPNADQDLIYKIRKFNYQVSLASALSRKLTASIEQQIANLRDEASQGMTEP
jgi:hypothetical protein